MGTAPVTDERIDAQTLAAFLDGTLSAVEREAVLTRLVRSDEAYDTLVEAHAVLAELEAAELGPAPDPTATSGGRHGSSGGGGVSGAPRPGMYTAPPFGRADLRPRRWLRRGLAATLTVVAATVFGIVYTRGRHAEFPALDRVTADSGAGVVLATAVERAAAGTVRGAGALAVTPHGQAFRIGVESLDLELAFRQRDARAARVLAGSLARQAAEVDGGQPVALRVAHLARAGAEVPEVAERARVAREVRTLARGSTGWFDLGVWVESARIAAYGRDARFFASTSPAMRDLSMLLTTVQTTPQEDASQTGAGLARLRELFAPPIGAGRLPTVAAALDSVVALVR